MNLSFNFIHTLKIGNLHLKKEEEEEKYPCSLITICNHRAEEEGI